MDPCGDKGKRIRTNLSVASRQGRDAERTGMPSVLLLLHVSAVDKTQQHAADFHPSRR